MLLGSGCGCGLALFAACFGYYHFIFLEHWRFPDMSFVERVEDPIAVVDDILSYQSMKEVEEELRRAGYTSITRNVGHDAGGHRPPFREGQLTVDGFRLRGYGGVAKFGFFNDRLMEMRFYPKSRHAEAAISEQMTAELERASAELTRIETATDYLGRPYVRVADTRLTHEVHVWIKRYS